MSDEAKVPAQLKSDLRIRDIATAARNPSISRDELKGVVSEAIETRRLNPKSVNFSKLWEEMIGPMDETLIRPTGLAEATVLTTAFGDIIDKVLSTITMTQWNDPKYVAETLYTVVPDVHNINFRMPGVFVTDATANVDEGDAYPEAALTDQAVMVEIGKKVGQQISLTKEDLWLDRTGLIQKKAEQMGMWVKRNMEITMLMEILSPSTYNIQSSGSNTAYDDEDFYGGSFGNTVSTNALSDYTNIDKAYQKLIAMRTADTSGLPVYADPKYLLVGPALRYAAIRMLSDTAHYLTGSIFNGGPEVFTAAEVRKDLGGLLPDIISPYFYPEAVAAIAATGYYTLAGTEWYLGDFAKQHTWFQLWPLEYAQVAVSAPERVTNDIVYRARVAYWGHPQTNDYRAVIKSYVGETYGR